MVVCGHLGDVHELRVQLRHGALDRGMVGELLYQCLLDLHLDAHQLQMEGTNKSPRRSRVELHKT